MTDVSPITFSIITVLAIGVLLWFALGTQRNIAKGNRILRWLQSGLPLLGVRTTLRWLGSSAIELKITDPEPPFAEVETVIVLEPRDLGWLWAVAHARGRRDFLILRARLERPPRFEIEAGNARGWTGEDRLRRLDADAWRRAEWGLTGVRVAHSEDADPDAVRARWVQLAEASGGVWRLSVRRDNPHVEVHLLVPDTARVEARTLFRDFKSLAEWVSKS